ncbi:MAG: ABC transporter permease [Planctomycetes bacterium]|nr:ABC transporter permease [Planctomycetota bacterium]
MGLPISYHWRNLLVRKTTTLLTLLVVAVVVGVFTWMMGFASSLTRSLAVASDETKLLILKRGATAESNSAIPIEDFNRLNQLSAIVRDEDNIPLLSPEMMAQVSLPRARDGGATFANVAVRGVTAAAFKVHRNVKLLGKGFTTGRREVIVGQAAAKQFAGLNVGDTIGLGYGSDRGYKVVGHFSAGGGPMESEIWGYLPSLMNAYNRKTYSCASLRLSDDADSAAAIERIRGPAIQLEAKTERQYWQAQSAGIRRYLTVAYALVAIMSVAAIFSIANTMFSTVAGRTREVAMLRTIGYSQWRILTGFVFESILLTTVGGIVGCLACVAWLSLVGNTKDMFGATNFTTLAFEIRVTPAIVLWSLLSVVAVGVIGSLIPALRAARTPVVSALRAP